ncbi:hypothetical protein DdX_03452 [Ditylenchus destructor]|uniref:SAP domain-containing protein n=1 Tax=Ditylenchus destructor TaxID=166010 RepID=A0AAD4NF17_9BILA|nr:hypothetical protein DdX_03452 [Ditylenchus destructor]
MKAKMTKGAKTAQKDDNSKLREKLEAMSWNELRAEAKTHDIKVTGKAAELIEKILAEAQNGIDENPSQQKQETNEKVNTTTNREEATRQENVNNTFREQLEALSWNDLRKEAKNRGVKTVGKAVDLIERILEKVQQNADENNDNQNADMTIKTDAPHNTSIGAPSTDELAEANELEQSKRNNPNLRSKQVQKENSSSEEENNANTNENGDPLNTTFTIETNVPDPDEKQGSFLTEDNSPASERKSRKRSNTSFLSNDKSASQLQTTGNKVSTTPANEISKIQSPNASQTPATTNRSAKLKNLISSSSKQRSSISVTSPSKALSQTSFPSSDNSFREVASAKRKPASITAATNKSNLNSVSPSSSKSLVTKKTLTTPKNTISTSTRTPRPIPKENLSSSIAENLPQASFLTSENNDSQIHPSLVMQMDTTPENLTGTKLTSPKKTHSGLLGSAILNSAVSRRSTSTRISASASQSSNMTQQTTENNDEKKTPLNFDSGRRSILTRTRKSTSALTPVVDEPPAKTPRLSRMLDQKTENVPAMENNHSALISPRSSTTKYIATTTPSIANAEEESLVKTPQPQEEIENHSLDLKMSLSGNRRSRVSSPRKSVRNRIQTPYHVSKAINVSSSRISRSSKRLQENVQNGSIAESCQSGSVSFEASTKVLNTTRQGEENIVSTPSGSFRSHGASSLKRTLNSAFKRSTAVTQKNVEDVFYASDVNQGSSKQSISVQRSTRKSVSFSSPFASPAKGSLITAQQTPGKPKELAQIDLAIDETADDPEKNASTSKGILGLNRFAKQHEKHFGLMPSILDTETKLKERHAKNSSVPDYVKRLASPKKTLVNRIVTRKSSASITPTLDEPPTKIRRSSVNRKEIADNTPSISENRPSKLVPPKKILRERNSTHNYAATFDEPVPSNELSFKFGDAEVSDMPKIQRPFNRSTTGFVSRLKTPKPVSVKRLTMRTPQENRRTPTVRLATEPVMSERLERLATPKNMNSGNRSMFTKSAEVRPKYTPYTGRFMYKDTSKMSAKELEEYNRNKRQNPNLMAHDFFHSSQ